MPEPGRYRRVRDGAAVEVIAVSGPDALDSVRVRRIRELATNRSWHVRLENFWKKYEPWPTSGGAA
jgi:hypothetical protein